MSMRTTPSRTRWVRERLEHREQADIDTASAGSLQLLPNRPASPSDAVLDDLDAEPADARAPSPPTPATSGFAPPRYSIALDGASGRPGSSSGPIDGEVGQFTHDGGL